MRYVFLWVEETSYGKKRIRNQFGVEIVRLTGIPRTQGGRCTHFSSDHNLHPKLGRLIGGDHTVHGRGSFSIFLVDERATGNKGTIFIISGLYAINCRTFIGAYSLYRHIWNTRVDHFIDLIRMYS
jgi:hypothetical protein